MIVYRESCLTGKVAITEVKNLHQLKRKMKKVFKSQPKLKKENLYLQSDGAGFLIYKPKLKEE